MDTAASDRRLSKVESDLGDWSGSDSVLELLPWLETPLYQKRNSIRLLTLHRGCNEDPIKCSLQVADLDDKTGYEALSYVWGDPSRTTPVTVGDAHFDVTQNLSDFLNCLRQPMADRVLWADAICINQNDEAEKRHQLRLMRRIYQQASEVHIWFGRFTLSWQDEISVEDFKPISRMWETDWERANTVCEREVQIYRNSGGQIQRPTGCADPFREPLHDILEETFVMLKQVAGGKSLAEFPLFVDVRHRDMAGRSTVLNKVWMLMQDCLLWLLSRPWWTRVWTLQEAVLPAVDPVVHIGPHTIDLSRMTKAVKAIIKHQHAPMRHNVTHIFCGLYRGPPKMGSCFQLAHELQILRDSFHQDSHTEPEVALWDAMDTSRRRSATNVADHLWGMLGLLGSDIREHFISQNFSRGCTDVFTRCSKILLTGTDAMRAIHEAIGVRRCTLPDLPSWAIDLTPDHEKNTKPKDIGWDHWELYDAASQSSQGCEPLLWGEIAGATLTLKSSLIGTVLSCATSFYERRDCQRTLLANLSEWHDTYTKCIRDCKRPYDAESFWRAVLMDRNIRLYWRHQRQPLPGRSLDEVQAWWQNYMWTADARDLTEDNLAGDGSRGTYHARAVEWNLDRLRFFCTKDGRPGLGPQEVAPADEIHVLAGCRALAVLRPVRRDGQLTVLFVGLCFVDGWMYGEALRKPGLQWQNITLY